MHSAVAVILGFSATAFAGLTLPAPLISGSSVSCSSGNVYCTDGSTTHCYDKTPGQTCSSGEAICCDSSSTVLNLQLLPICGNAVDLSVPVTVTL